MFHELKCFENSYTLLKNVRALWLGLGQMFYRISFWQYVQIPYEFPYNWYLIKIPNVRFIALTITEILIMVINIKKERNC